MGFTGVYLIFFVTSLFGFQLSSAVEYSGSVLIKNACQNSSFVDVPGFYDANMPVTNGMAFNCKNQHCFILKPWDYPVKYTMELLLSVGPSEISAPVTCCLSGDTSPGCPQDNFACQTKCSNAYGTAYARTGNWFCSVDTLTGSHNPIDTTRVPFKNFCICELCACARCSQTQVNCKQWDLKPTTVQSCSMNNHNAY